MHHQPHRRLARGTQHRLEPDQVVREQLLGAPHRAARQRRGLVAREQAPCTLAGLVVIRWRPAREGRMPHIVRQEQIGTKPAKRVVEPRRRRRRGVLVLQQREQQQRTMPQHPVRGHAGREEPGHAQIGDGHPPCRRRLAVGLQHLGDGRGAARRDGADERGRPPDSGGLVPPIDGQVAAATGIRLVRESPPEQGRCGAIAPHRCEQIHELCGGT